MKFSRLPSAVRVRYYDTWSSSDGWAIECPVAWVKSMIERHGKIEVMVDGRFL